MMHACDIAAHLSRRARAVGLHTDNPRGRGCSICLVCIKATGVVRYSLHDLSQRRGRLPSLVVSDCSTSFSKTKPIPLNVTWSNVVRFLNKIWHAKIFLRYRLVTTLFSFPISFVSFVLYFSCQLYIDEKTFNKICKSYAGNSG